MEIGDWKNIEISVDLIQAAKYHLEFLKKFDKINFVGDKAHLKKSIFRYENVWLPFFNSKYDERLKLAPPIDIVLVWHSHMLSPISYKNDCMKVFGRLLDWNLMSQNEYGRRVDITKPYWREYSNEPYDYTDNKLEDAEYKSKLEYDLESACERQIQFYYQVSLPHYNDDKYLSHGIKRYRMFLHYKRLNKNEFVIPCFLIDLLWHTHQLHPVIYKNDMLRILGMELPHDDSINDRSEDSTLNLLYHKMKSNWLKFYNEKYFFAGAMFRGYPFRDCTVEERGITFPLKCVKSGWFILDEIKLTSTSSEKPRNFTVKVYLNEEARKKLYSFILNPQSSAQKPNFKYEFNDIKKAFLSLTVIIEEFKKPIIVLEKQLSLDNSMLKEWEIDFLSSYTLNFKWKYSFSKNINYLTLDMIRDKFQPVEISRNLKFYEFNINEKICSHTKIQEARHKIHINKESNLKFCAKVIQLTNSRFHAIEILLNDKGPLVIAKIIGYESLPTDSLTNLNLKLNENEKAILVENSCSDVAILIGKIEMNLLKIRIFYNHNGFDDSKTIEINDTSPFEFDYKHIKVSVNFNSSMVQLNSSFVDSIDCIDISSIIALVFSFAVLNFICKQK